MTSKPNEENVPSAYVELLDGTGSLGVWLVSTDISAAQGFSYAGREWMISLRKARRSIRIIAPNATAPTAKIFAVNMPARLCRLLTWLRTAAASTPIPRMSP